MKGITVDPSSTKLDIQLARIQMQLQNIIIAMNKRLNGGIIHFEDVLSLQRPPKVEDIKTFFMTMEVWGEQEDDSYQDGSKKLESLKT